jgi:hypothetical protein
MVEAFSRALTAVVGLAADGADGDAGFFAHAVGDLGEILAALFAEFGDGDADEAAVVEGGDADVGGENGLFDGGEGGGVVGFDDDQAGLGGADEGHLVEAGLGAVALDVDLVDEAGGGLAGAEAGESLVEVLEGLFHFVVGFEQDIIGGFVHGVSFRLQSVSGGDQGAGLFAAHHAEQFPALEEIKDEYRDLVVHAKRKGGGVHDLQAAGERFGVGEAVELDGLGVFHRVGVVDAVDLGGLEQDLGADFGGAQGGGAVGGEEGIAGAAADEDDGARLEQLDGAAEGEEFAEGRQAGGGKGLGGDAGGLEGGLAGRGC